MYTPPLWLRVRLVTRGTPRLKLWFPLFLLWPVLALCALFLAPLVLLALVVAFFWFSVRLELGALLLGFYEVLCALKGLNVEVGTGRYTSTVVEVDIR